jgi:HEPN domain-containing protein
MKILFTTNDEAGFDSVCYHAQQCIEKLLKGLCIEYDVASPRSHDLQKLVDLLIPKFPELKRSSNQLKALTNLGAEFRYPDEFASTHDAERAMALCTELRESLRTFLGPTEGMLFP